MRNKSIFTLIMIILMGTPFLIYDFLKSKNFICNPQYQFKLEIGSKFKIENDAIIAYNFREESYVHYSQFFHIFGMEHHLLKFENESNIKKYDFKPLIKDFVFEVQDCHNFFGPPPILILRGTDSKTYAISFWDFRKFKIIKL